MIRIRLIELEISLISQYKAGVKRSLRLCYFGVRLFSEVKMEKVEGLSSVLAVNLTWKAISRFI